MPLYAKFLKDMLTQKNKYIHSDTIVVEGNCSVVIQRILPPKHKDPGSVTVPCSIDEVFVGKALIDLGAIINLMSLSMCRRLEYLLMYLLLIVIVDICPSFFSFVVLVYLILFALNHGFVV